MATDALSAHGTLFKMGDAASPEVFTTLGRVKDISGPSMSGTVIDVTDQESADHFKEFIMGLLDAGEITFEINWNPALTTHGNTTGGVLWWFRTRRKGNIQLVFFTSAGTFTLTIAAIIPAFGPGSPMDGAQTSAVTFKLSGPPAWS